MRMQQGLTSGMLFWVGSDRMRHRITNKIMSLLCPEQLCLAHNDHNDSRLCHVYVIDRNMGPLM